MKLRELVEELVDSLFEGGPVGVLQNSEHGYVLRRFQRKKTHEHGWSMEYQVVVTVNQNTDLFFNFFTNNPIDVIALHQACINSQLADSGTTFYGNNFNEGFSVEGFDTFVHNPFAKMDWIIDKDEVRRLKHPRDIYRDDITTEAEREFYERRYWDWAYKVVAERLLEFWGTKRLLKIFDINMDKTLERLMKTLLLEAAGDFNTDNLEGVTLVAPESLYNTCMFLYMVGLMPVVHETFYK